MINLLKIFKIETLLLCAIFILFYLSSTAQQFTIQGGITSSTLMSENAMENSDEIHGGNFSILLDMDVTDYLGVRSGLELVSRGGKIVGSVGSLNFDFSTLFAQVQLPVYAALNLNFDSSRFSVYLGPSFAGIIDARNANGNSLSIGENEIYRRYNTNLDAGISLRYNRISIGSSYSHGLTDITNEINVIKNRALSFHLGYLLNKKK